MDIEIDYLKNKPSFIPQIAQWLFEEWGYHNPSRSCEAKIEDLKKRLHLDQMPLTIVATVDGVSAGTASLIFDDLRDRPDLNPWLADVFVCTEFRGHGIGSALCEFAAKAAAQIKLERLYLFTKNQENLYARLGWKEVEKCVYRSELVTVMSIDPLSTN